MTENESAFLCGLLRKFRPTTILEISVAGGGTTSIMLQCMNDLGESFKMLSVDLFERYYRDKKQKSDFLAKITNEN